MILTVTLVASESLAVGTVMPLVEDDLGDLWLYGWVFSAFFLGNLVGIVVAGRASDRMHPAVPFASGLVLFAVGLLLAGFAPTMPVLVGARLLQGLGAGTLPATVYVCIGRGYPAVLRPRMFALLSTAWVVPGLVGPAIAAVVGERFGWRWIFLGLVPLLVAAGLPALMAVRHSIPDRPEPAVARSRTGRDAVLVAVAAAVFLGGLSVEPRLLGLVPAVGAAWVGLAVYRRLVPAGTLRMHEGLPATIGLRGVLTWAFFSANAFIPLALVDVRGTSTRVVGLTLAAATLCWTTGAWIQERTVFRLGPRRLVTVGFLGLTGALVLALASLSSSVSPTVMVVAWGVAGLSVGPAYASLSVTVLALAPEGGEGAATSSLQLTDVLGVALGTGLAGAVVAFGEDLGAALAPTLVVVFAVAASIAAIGAVLSRRLPASL